MQISDIQISPESLQSFVPHKLSHMIEFVFFITSVPHIQISGDVHSNHKVHIIHAHYTF